MIVDVETKALCQIDIDSYEAFRLLCKTLCMEYILDEDRNFYINKNEYNENEVWEMINGQNDEYIDDRADLFIALRNVAVNMFPNVYFRSEDYIYNK